MTSNILSLPGMASKAKEREPVAEVVELLRSALACALTGHLRSVVVVGMTATPSVYSDRAAVTAFDGYMLAGTLHVQALELSAQLSSATGQRDRDVLHDEPER